MSMRRNKLLDMSPSVSAACGRCWQLQFCFSILLVSLLITITDTSDFHSADGALELTRDNFDEAIANSEFTFINFYADWCRFSQILEPVFNEVANNVKKDFTTPGSVLLGKVDCDKQPEVAAKYHISKYPTLKMFRNGEVQKKEYRGQRSVDSLTTFVKDQLKDPVREFKEYEQIEENNEKKRKVIGYFDVKQSPEYDSFRKLASTLRSDCEFWAGFGEASASERPAGNTVVFRDPRSKSDVVYPADITNYKLLFQWAQDKCIPLVREITFENAEELTEEGIPFLILFHNPDDTKSVEEYSKIISSELLQDRYTINFLTADGLKFAHPLHHLGKSQKDLPLIAIDSFRHMYLLPKYEDARIPGRLKQFVADLHSGKLHREFHQGPDPTEPPAQVEEQQKDQKQQPEEKQQQQQQQQRVIGDDGDSDDDVVDDLGDAVGRRGQQDMRGQAKTSPPESTFKKLAPSKTRYTLLRDEL